MLLIILTIKQGEIKITCAVWQMSSFTYFGSFVKFKYSIQMEHKL